MAKNKRAVDRRIKTGEIEAAASRLFIERGFEATSMAMIATAADVAPNTLYWYYKNKDDMLVAVLNRLIAAGLSELEEKGEQPLGQQLTWVFDKFAQASNLVSTVHSRVALSDSVRDWHDQFHELLENVLIQRLSAAGIAVARAKLMATVGTFVVEGLLSHPHSPSQREAVVAWLVSSMT